VTGSPVVRRFRGHVAVELDEQMTSNAEVAVDVAGDLLLYTAFRSVRISHTPDIQRFSSSMRLPQLRQVPVETDVVERLLRR